MAVLVEWFESVCKVVIDRPDKRNAVDLAAHWPQATLVIVPDAGHTGTEQGIADAMVRATDLYSGL